MTESTAPVNKDVIDGSVVLKRQSARLFTPLSKYPDRMSPTYGVDECELKDGRKVFQCVYPDFEDCDYWHMSGASVRSHLRVHAKKIENDKIAQIKAERDQLLAREAQRKENYRDGALRGAANRKLNNAKRANGENGNAHNNDYINTSSENGNEELVMAKMADAADRRKKIDNAQTALEGVAEGLAKVRTVIANMTKTLDNTVSVLEDLATEAPAVDPVLAEKAASWDAIQGLLNPKR